MEQGLHATDKTHLPVTGTNFCLRDLVPNHTKRQCANSNSLPPTKSPPTTFTPPMPISTPLTFHTSPDERRGDSIQIRQEARKLDAIEKVHDTRKESQEKEFPAQKFRTIKKSFAQD